MTVDPMERLARANPVPEPPPVASPEGLRRSIEDDSPSEGPNERPRKHPRARRALVGVASVACASIATVLLLAGSSDRSLNVLAAVYAATTPKPGIVEAVTLTHTYGGPGHDSVDRLREWSDVSAGLRRGLTSFEGSSPSHRGAGQIDVVYAPRTWEAWSNARGSGSLPWNGVHAPDVVHRIHWSGSFHPDDRHMGFIGGGLVGAEWAATYRTLYRKGQMRVVGHERHSGRLLWKLEANPAQAEARAREDHTQFYVLVDPHTFLPVYTRLINLALPGHPTVYESELLSYRTLPSTTVNERVFDLVLQHPGARVLSQAGVKPPAQSASAAHR